MRSSAVQNRSIFSAAIPRSPLRRTGSPTTIVVAARSSAIRTISARSSRRADRSMTPTGRAYVSLGSEAARPMRRSPTSSARTAMALGRPRRELVEHARRLGPFAEMIRYERVGGPARLRGRVQRRPRLPGPGRAQCAEVVDVARLEHERLRAVRTANGAGEAARIEVGPGGTLLEVATAAHAGVGLRPDAERAEQPQLETRDERARIRHGRHRVERTVEQRVELRHREIRFAEGVDQLGQQTGGRERRLLHERGPARRHDVGAGNDVETAPAMHPNVDFEAELKAAAEVALLAAHALADGVDLAADVGQQREDLVGLAEVAGTQDDGPRLIRSLCSHAGSSDVLLVADRFEGVGRHVHAAVRMAPVRHDDADAQNAPAAHAFDLKKHVLGSLDRLTLTRESTE